MLYREQTSQRDARALVAAEFGAVPFAAIADRGNTFADLDDRDEQRPRALEFGRFRLHTHSRELFADGVPVRLGSRAIEVLFALVEAHGRLVTKSELMDRIWPAAAVEENCLQFQISRLRKALGPDRDLIRTISRYGYRFVAEVAPAHMASHQTAEVIDHRKAHATPTNLPAQTSDLIGRQDQLANVGALVCDNRLVTLAGAGGIGKTRLAIEAARRLLPQFPGGVWLVELGAVSDLSDVLHSIGTALGDSESLSLAELAARIGSERRLVVLDNCEHLIGAAAAAVETLLHVNGALRVIATSREPLRADAEWIYRVPALDTPPEDARDVEEMLANGAAQLFVARSSASAKDCADNPAMARAIAKICRRLDGIPLAIELAAATATMLGVEWLASRVDDQLNLLTDGRRTAPARQRTLRGAFDWSYDLLSEPERAVMRRLAVFGGDFTVEEASAIVDDRGGLAASQVLASVATLVAKSIIVRDDSSSAPRYRLLQTTRAYAMAKLKECGEGDAGIRVAA